MRLVLNEARGAIVDLTLVDGGPIAGIKLIVDPERSFVLIVKVAGTALS